MISHRAIRPHIAGNVFTVYCRCSATRNSS